jgi:hypothetical protein
VQLREGYYADDKISSAMIAGRFNIRVFGTLVVPAMLMASCSSSSNSEAQPSATVSTYQGQWNGSYRINSSAPVPSAAYAHMCNGWAPGVVLPLSITMTQNGQSVIGQFTTNDSLVVTVVSPSFDSG